MGEEGAGEGGYCAGLDFDSLGSVLELEGFGACDLGGIDVDCDLLGVF